MKLILFLLLSNCSFGAIALVRQATGTAASGTSVSVTITAPTAGDMLILTLRSNPLNSTVSAVSGGGCTWSSVIAGATNRVAAIWKCPNSSGSGTTITITLANATTNSIANVSEWSGMDSSGTTDGTSTTSGANATPASTAISTTNANDLVVAVMGWGATSGAVFNTGPNNSFTALTTTSNVAFDAAYQIESSTGSYSTGYGVGGTGPVWDFEAAAFKASVVANTTPPAVR